MNKFRVIFGHGVVVVPNEKIQESVEDVLTDMDISGTASVEMREFDGYIQYSADGKTWKNVVALSDLKGDPGKPGEQGEPGKPGSDANVTADSIRNALGYTPADGEELAGLGMALDELNQVAGWRPVVYSSMLNGNTIIIEERMELLNAYPHIREVLLYGFAENKILAAKVYPKTDMLPTLAAVGTLYTQNGDGADDYTAESCVIYLAEEGDHVVGSIVAANTVISESVKTEIAEQAAGLVDMALLAIIGEVTE